MQVYVHSGIGLVLGQKFFPDDYQGAIVIGASIVSDIPALMIYVRSRLKKEEPFKEFSNRFLLIQNIFHSFMVWLAIGILSYYHQILLPLFIGGFSHSFTDFLTHKGDRFRAEDPSFIWPLPGSLYGFGFVEYRQWAWEKHKGIKRFFSWPEILITCLCVAILIILKYDFWPKGCG